MIEAYIKNYRRGRNTVNPRFAIVYPKEEVNLDTLIGHSVILKWKDRTIKGKVTARHGSKALRVFFKNSFPGQAIGKEVFID
jgi:ribosomal protein L35AE/L33A